MKAYFLCVFLLLATTARGGNNTAYRNVAYFVDWAVYDRDFTPQQLPLSSLTHVIYAFANIKPDGEVYLSDENAALKMQLSGGLPDTSEQNLYGCLQQLYLLKKQNRHLKVLLSIGGWSYSANFAVPASTAEGRAAFASSATALVKDLGFDGLDVDWEYPGDNAQAQNQVLLLKAVRKALDEYGKSLSSPYHFLLTVASPAGPSNYELMQLAEMDKLLDFWNLMCYDYSGSFSQVTAHQANIFKSSSHPMSTPFDSETAVNYYISQGITANKIVLGIPLYGRSFAATELGVPFDHVGGGTWEAGVYDFKALQGRAETEKWDSSIGAAYMVDYEQQELITYDNLATVLQKSEWVRKLGLGGVMWWESSADGDHTKLGMSLIKSAATFLAKNDSSLESAENLLIYSDSRYNNLRTGMSSSEIILSKTTSVDCATDIDTSAEPLQTPPSSSSALEAETPSQAESLSGSSQNGHTSSTALPTTTISQSPASLQSGWTECLIGLNCPALWSTDCPTKPIDPIPRVTIFTTTTLEPSVLVVTETILVTL